MPVFDVNSEGVSFAMSFICGLSTMATLSEPPFDVDAAVPPLVLLVLEPPPPQPTATTLTMASTATADPRPIVRLISHSPCFARRAQDTRRNVGLIAWVYVGCQGPRCMAQQVIQSLCRGLFC